MTRVPITQPSYEIIMSQEPVKFTDLLPKYRYEFQNRTIPEESNHMYQSLIDFMETNQSLALEAGNTEEFQKGFQRAMSLVRLWMDSLYLFENPPK